MYLKPPVMHCVKTSMRLRKKRMSRRIFLYGLLATALFPLRVFAVEKEDDTLKTDEQSSREDGTKEFELARRIFSEEEEVEEEG